MRASRPSRVTTVSVSDAHDRKISETYQDNSKRTYAFDSASDVVTYTDENGVAFQHDGHNGHNDWRGRVGARGI